MGNEVDSIGQLFHLNSGVAWPSLRGTTFLNRLQEAHLSDTGPRLNSVVAAAGHLCLVFSGQDGPQYCGMFVVDAIPPVVGSMVDNIGDEQIGRNIINQGPGIAALEEPDPTLILSLCNKTFSNNDFVMASPFAAAHFRSRVVDCVFFGGERIPSDDSECQRGPSDAGRSSPLRLLVALDTGVCYVWEWELSNPSGKRFGELARWVYLQSFCILRNRHLTWTKPLQCLSYSELSEEVTWIERFPKGNLSSAESRKGSLATTVSRPAKLTRGVLGESDSHTDDDAKEQTLCIRKLVFKTSEGSSRKTIYLGEVFSFPVNEIRRLVSTMRGLWAIGESELLFRSATSDRWLIESFRDLATVKTPGFDNVGHGFSQDIVESDIAPAKNTKTEASFLHHWPDMIFFAHHDVTGEMMSLRRSSSTSCELCVIKESPSGLIPLKLCALVLQKCAQSDTRNGGPENSKRILDFTVSQYLVYTLVSLREQSTNTLEMEGHTPWSVRCLIFDIYAGTPLAAINIPLRGLCRAIAPQEILATPVQVRFWTSTASGPVGVWGNGYVGSFSCPSNEVLTDRVAGERERMNSQSPPSYGERVGEVPCSADTSGSVESLSISNTSSDHSSQSHDAQVVLQRLVRWCDSYGLSTSREAVRFGIESVQTNSGDEESLSTIWTMLAKRLESPALLVLLLLLKLDDDQSETERFGITLPGSASIETDRTENERPLSNFKPPLNYFLVSEVQSFVRHLYHDLSKVSARFEVAEDYKSGPSFESDANIPQLRQSKSLSLLDSTVFFDLEAIATLTPLNLRVGSSLASLLKIVETEMEARRSVYRRLDDLSHRRAAAKSCEYSHESHPQNELPAIQLCVKTTVDMIMAWRPGFLPYRSSVSLTAASLDPRLSLELSFHVKSLLLELPPNVGLRGFKEAARPSHLLFHDELSLAGGNADLRQKLSIDKGHERRLKRNAFVLSFEETRLKSTLSSDGISSDSELIRRRGRSFESMDSSLFSEGQHLAGSFEGSGKEVKNGEPDLSKATTAPTYAATTPAATPKHLYFELVCRLLGEHDPPVLWEFIHLIERKCPHLLKHSLLTQTRLKDRSFYSRALNCFSPLEKQNPQWFFVSLNTIEDEGPLNVVERKSYRWAAAHALCLSAESRHTEALVLLLEFGFYDVATTLFVGCSALLSQTEVNPLLQAFSLGGFSDEKDQLFCDYSKYAGSSTSNPSKRESSPCVRVGMLRTFCNTFEQFPFSSAVQTAAAYKALLNYTFNLVLEKVGQNIERITAVSQPSCRSDDTVKTEVYLRSWIAEIEALLSLRPSSVPTASIFLDFRKLAREHSGSLEELREADGAKEILSALRLVLQTLRQT